MKVHECDGKWFDDSGIPLPALTLPLRVGQRVICGDGEERKIISNDPDPGPYPWNYEGPYHALTEDGKSCIGISKWDAIADAPGWTAESGPGNDSGVPDSAASAGGGVCPIHENKKMCPAGCGAKHASHHESRPYKCPWLLKFMEHQQSYHTVSDCVAFADAHWREFVKPDEKKEQAAAAGSANTLDLACQGSPPAAQPAILPTWTLGDLCAYADRHGLRGSARSESIEDLRALVFHHLRIASGPKTVVLDRRPDIPQPDCSSDSFVARRWWRP